MPQDHGTVVRVALESLALRYRQVLEYIEALVGNRLETVHIVGGGTRNQQLCQMTANACGRRVVAGPIEATAIGNVAMQAIATGALSGAEEARRVIRDSYAVTEYLPRETPAWEVALLAVSQGGGQLRRSPLSKAGARSAGIARQSVNFLVFAIDSADRRLIY